MILNLFDCYDDLFGDGVLCIGYVGEVYGLCLGLWFDMKWWIGVVFFVIGIVDEVIKGMLVFMVIEE